MERRILSLWLPWFAVDRLRRRPGGGAGDGPLALSLRDRGRLYVAAVDRRAQAVGIGPGMPLADARALEPDLSVRDADPVADAAALDRLCAWARHYTPWTAIDRAEQPAAGAGGLWLDITGCAHLFGGEEELGADLAGRLARAGLQCRVAVADTAGAAWAVARFGVPEGRGLGAVSIVPSGRQREFLSPLPVAALRLPAATVTGLGRVGLHRIGDLLRQPRAALASRYGPLPALQLDRALGGVDEPICPRRPGHVHRARLVFMEPISTPDDIHRAVRHLLEEVCRGLTAAGQGARRLILDAWRVDADPDDPPQTVEVGTSRVQRDPAHLFRLFAQKLDRIESGPGFEVMVLSVPMTEPFASIQMEAPGLAPAVRTGRPLDGPSLNDVLDRIGARLGFRRILHPQPRESWWPERAVEMRPADAPAPRVRPSPWPADRPRPVRLLPRPEPVEVTAPVPDDPPLAFRWRDRLYRVRAAEGPERLSPEWWLEPGAPEGDPRDYYRVETADGRRYWLYRLGLYGSGRPTLWYLHGFLG